MNRIRSLAGALALCLLHACVPASPEQPSTDETEGGEEGERYGALPARNLALDQSTLADITSPVVADNGMKVLCFQFVVIATGDPVAVIEIQGSINGVDYNPIYLDANKIPGTAAAWAGGTQVPVSDPAATQSLHFCIENPLPYMRLFYDRTSGGAAAGADIYTRTLQN